jgi:hypothetical protein
MTGLMTGLYDGHKTPNINSRAVSADYPGGPSGTAILAVIYRRGFNNRETILFPRQILRRKDFVP